MEILEELVRIISPQKIAKVSVMHRHLPATSKLMQLYKGISQKEFDSDESAALTLYGTTDTGSKYSKIKYELRERLINTIHLIPLVDHNDSEISRAYFRYYSRLTTARFLMVLGASQAGINLLQKILVKAQEFEFTDVIIEAARLLRAYHGSNTGNAAALMEYTQVIQKYLRLYQNELVGEELYYDLLSQYVQDKSTKIHLAVLAEQYLNQLQPALQEDSSLLFIFRYRMIELMSVMCKQDYSATIDICKTAVKELSSRSFYYPQHLLLFYFQWISCCIQLRRREEGFQIIETALQLLKPKTFNWYRAKSLEMQLCLYHREYQHAFDIYTDCANPQHLKYIPAAMQEEWLIYSAYLHLLLEAGLLQLTEKEISRSLGKKFRLQKFLNETIVYTRDKKGVNVAILIVEIMFLFLQRQVDQLINRSEALEKYMQRYLHNEGCARSKQFLKLILLTIQNDFSRKKLGLEYEKHLAELKSFQHDTLSKNHAQEIIPYEHLWEIIYATLE